MLWYRGWALDQDEERVCEQAREVMKKVGVRRMVMGHTPNFEVSREREGLSIFFWEFGGLGRLRQGREEADDEGADGKLTRRSLSFFFPFLRLVLSS